MIKLNEMYPSNGKIRCPKCQSQELKFQIRQEGIQSTTNYYHFLSRVSWIIPSWHKKYRNTKKYISIAQCQHCGYLFEPKHKSDWLQVLLCVLFLPIFLCILFFNSDWFKTNKKPFFITIGIAFVVIIVLFVVALFTQ